MKLITVKRRWIIGALLGLFLAIGFFLFNPLAHLTGGTMSADDNETYHINMVTGEFKSETKSGEEIESYRWDPGTIHIPKGEPVTLSIFGVNGEEHPFIIEGTNVKGTVKKGEETLLNLQFNESGTYKLICTAHETMDDNGPMIAYLIVQ
ncbi:cupredoxin domain-containing protein [Salipaludibacillus sp. HK11]|uniref:cupredoxin domain-containing protein n=1 Tax=Salipaludibacillus sp. HK11 TaxID=3394320 RepID=UPI0039FD0DC8